MPLGKLVGKVGAGKEGGGRAIGQGKGNGGGGPVGPSGVVAGAELGPEGGKRGEDDEDIALEPLNGD